MKVLILVVFSMSMTSTAFAQSAPGEDRTRDRCEKTYNGHTGRSGTVVRGGRGGATQGKEGQQGG